MKNMDSHSNNNKISDEKKLLTCILIMSAFFIMYTVIIRCMLPVGKSNHQNRIEKLNNQLLIAENEEESFAVNVLIKMENKDWAHQIEANHNACIISLAFSIALPVFWFIYIILSRAVGILMHY